MFRPHIWFLWTSTWMYVMLGNTLSQSMNTMLITSSCCMAVSRIIYSWTQRLIHVKLYRWMALICLRFHSLGNNLIIFKWNLCDRLMTRSWCVLLLMFACWSLKRRDLDLFAANIIWCNSLYRTSSELRDCHHTMQWWRFNVIIMWMV